MRLLTTENGGLASIILSSELFFLNFRLLLTLGFLWTRCVLILWKMYFFPECEISSKTLIFLTLVFASSKTSILLDKSFDLLLTSDGDFGGMEAEGLPLKYCFRVEEPAALCSFMNEDSGLPWWRSG